MEYAERKNPIGYYEACPKPSVDELSSYYANKYYQEDHVQYSSVYPDEEIKYFHNVARVALATATRFDVHKSLLDLGCGEGFFAKPFHDSVWEISCCDYSEFGIAKHNPDLLPFFSAGDIYQTLQQYKNESREYGVVNLQNVLEHVIEPAALLEDIKPLIAGKGVIRVRVPNDYSEFQLELVAAGHTINTWFNAPEHLSYFNNESLINILEGRGYEILSMQADFPIEIFLANPNSNYWRDRSLGKGAHRARVFCENYLIEKNVDDYIEYSSVAAKLGFGRELIAYAAVV